MYSRQIAVDFRKMSQKTASFTKNTENMSKFYTPTRSILQKMNDSMYPTPNASHAVFLLLLLVLVPK